MHTLYSASTKLLTAIICWVFTAPLLAAPFVATVTESLGPDILKQAQLPSSQAGAEILQSLYHSTLDSDGNWFRRNYYAIRINDQEAARDYGRIEIGYNHYYSDASLEFANVVSPSGTLTPVSKDAVQIRVVGGGQDFYDDQSEIVFSLPNIAPGSTVEFQFVTKTKRRAIATLSSDAARPHWVQRKVARDGWRTDHVRNFEYRLTTPKNTELFIQNHKEYKNQKEKKNGDNLVRTWQWKNIPLAALESFTAPVRDILPGLRVSTSKDWSLVDAWTWGMVKDKIQPTKALKAIVKNLNLQKNATRDQKIKAVYQFMQTNVRYVFAHLERGGYEPHFPDEALQNGYGDCKDQTVLAVALLRMLNVEAYPVLVETPNAGKSDTSLVRLIFDHMLVWVAPTKNAPALWMDTTGDRALFPGMSNYLVDQPALIINGKGGTFKTVDVDFEPNIVELKLDYKTADDGKTIVNALYSGRGFYEQHLRQWWTRDTNRDTSLRQFLSGIFNNSSQYTISFDVLNTDDLFNPSYIQATFTFLPTDDDRIIFGTSFNQINNLMGEIKSMQVPETRVNDWLDSREIEFHLVSRFYGNEGVNPALISSSDSTHSKYFTLMQDGKKDKNNFYVTMTYTKPALNLTTQEYAEYYNQLLQLGEQQGWVVNMALDPKHKRLVETKKIQKTFGNKSFEYQIALARKNIESGEFEDALPPAREAVKLNPTNGEAWFILGTAQGFNMLIDESNQSFKKSKTLGYVP